MGKRFTAKASFSRSAALRETVLDPSCGAIATFEGLVRNHNEGLTVQSLEYSCLPVLATKEGQRIIDETLANFDIIQAVCVHRIGHLAIGDAAVIVHVSSHHRAAAFDACRFLMDRLKAQVPIFKQERLASSDGGGSCPAAGVETAATTIGDAKRAMTW